MASFWRLTTKQPQSGDSDSKAGMKLWSLLTGIGGDSKAMLLEVYAIQYDILTKKTLVSEYRAKANAIIKKYRSIVPPHAIEAMEKFLNACLYYGGWKPGSFAIRREAAAKELGGCYLLFNNVKTFTTWYGNLPENQKVWHEVVHPESPARAAFDIDAEQEKIDLKIKNSDGMFGASLPESGGLAGPRAFIFHSIVKCIEKVFLYRFDRKLDPEQIVVLDASDSHKFSRHVVLKGVHFHDHSEVCSFAWAVDAALAVDTPECYSFLDLGASTRFGGSLRICGSHKWKSDRTLKIISREGDDLHTLEDTLIQCIDPEMSEELPLRSTLDPSKNSELIEKNHVSRYSFILDALTKNKDIVETYDLSRIGECESTLIAPLRVGKPCFVCGESHTSEFYGKIVAYILGKDIFVSCPRSNEKHSKSGEGKERVKIATIAMDAYMLDVLEAINTDISAIRADQFPVLPNPILPTRARDKSVPFVSPNRVGCLKSDDKEFIAERKVDVDDFASAIASCDTFVGRSPPGTGKTEAMATILAKMDTTHEAKMTSLVGKDATTIATQAKSRIVVWAISCKRALARQLTTTFNAAMTKAGRKSEPFKCYLDISEKRIHIRKYDRLVIQVESLHRLAVENPCGEGCIYPDILFLDEINEVCGQFEHVSKSMRYALGPNARMFEALVRNSKKVICFDALLDQRSLEVMKFLRPFASHQWKSYENFVAIGHGRKNIKVISKDDMSSFMLQCLMEGKNVAMCANSLRAVKSCYGASTHLCPDLEKEGKIRMFTSETAGSAGSKMKEARKNSKEELKVPGVAPEALGRLNLEIALAREAKKVPSLLELAMASKSYVVPLLMKARNLEKADDSATLKAHAKITEEWSHYSNRLAEYREGAEKAAKMTQKDKVNGDLVVFKILCEEMEAKLESLRAAKCRSDAEFESCRLRNAAIEGLFNSEAIRREILRAFGESPSEVATRALWEERDATKEKILSEIDRDMITSILKTCESRQKELTSDVAFKAVVEEVEASARMTAEEKKKVALKDLNQKIQARVLEASTLADGRKRPSLEEFATYLMKIIGDGVPLSGLLSFLTSYVESRSKEGSSPLRDDEILQIAERVEQDLARESYEKKKTKMETLFASEERSNSTPTTSGPQKSPVILSEEQRKKGLRSQVKAFLEEIEKAEDGADLNTDYNEVAKRTQFFLFTPVINSGVSITCMDTKEVTINGVTTLETKEHFDELCCYFTDRSSDYQGAFQQMGRIRHTQSNNVHLSFFSGMNTQRYPTSFEYFVEATKCALKWPMSYKEPEEGKEQLQPEKKQMEHKILQIVNSVSSKVDANGELDFVNDFYYRLHIWNMIARNRSKNAFVFRLIGALRLMGCSVERLENMYNEESLKNVKELTSAFQVIDDAKMCLSLVKAPNVSRTGLDSLRRMSVRTPEEQLTLKKAEIRDCMMLYQAHIGKDDIPVVEMSPELVYECSGFKEEGGIYHLNGLLNNWCRATTRKDPQTPIPLDTPLTSLPSYEAAMQQSISRVAAQIAKAVQTVTKTDGKKPVRKTDALVLTESMKRYYGDKCCLDLFRMLGFDVKLHFCLLLKQAVPLKKVEEGLAALPKWLEDNQTYVREGFGYTKKVEIKGSAPFANKMKLVRSMLKKHYGISAKYRKERSSDLRLEGHPDFVWDPIVFRPRWRVVTVLKSGKTVQEIYDESIASIEKYGNYKNIDEAKRPALAGAVKALKQELGKIDDDSHTE